MIVVNGQECQCAKCGAVFRLPDGELPCISFEAGARVLRVGGDEVHRCSGAAPNPPVQ